MRAYFSQFGDITRLRLSRNRITGRSKHYAFVEFASAVAARIVAQTMDNYLMYGHILKCKYVPQEQLHPEIWKGANRRFKRTPWNKIEKERLERGKTKEQWSKNIEKEQVRRLAKAEKLKDLGYDLELPKLKSVDEVRVQAKEGNPIEAGTSIANGAEKEPANPLEAAFESGNDKQRGDVPEPTPKPKKKKHKKGVLSNNVKDMPKQAALKMENATKATAVPSTFLETKKAQKTPTGNGKPKTKK
jgi:nucleolar protein 15